MVVESQVLNAIAGDVRDEDLDGTRRRAYERTCEVQAKQKEGYDKRRAAPKRFKVDDLVVVRRTIASNDGASKKLLQKYAGPYRVTKVMDLDRYLIEDIKGAPVTQKPCSGVVPSDKLKIWSVEVSEDESEEESGDEREDE